MSRLVLVILFSLVIFVPNTKAEEIFLKCGSGETSNFKYVNLKKNLVGESYLQKNKKDLFIYDWIHEDVKINYEKIEFKNTMAFLYGYTPKKKNYDKVIIDRLSGRMEFYEKDPYILDKFLPSFFTNLIPTHLYVWMFQSWKKSTTTVMCNKQNVSNLNLKYILKKDYLAAVKNDEMIEYFKNRNQKF